MAMQFTCATEEDQLFLWLSWDSNGSELWEKLFWIWMWLKSHLVYFCLCSKKIVFEICKSGLCSQVLSFFLTLYDVVLPTVHANIFSCYSGKKKS